MEKGKGKSKNNKAIRRRKSNLPTFEITDMNTNNEEQNKEKSGVFSLELLNSKKRIDREDSNDMEDDDSNSDDYLHNEPMSIEDENDEEDDEEIQVDFEFFLE